MSEDEANTKWCPFARVGLTHKGKIDIAPHSPAINRTVIGLHEGSRCIGSACMAWRWAKGSFYDPQRELMVHDMGAHGVGVAGGYCGLAGQP